MKNLSVLVYRLRSMLILSKELIVNQLILRKRYVVLTLFSLFLVVGQVNAQRPFITTWKTDNPGVSENNQITITTTGSGYNYNVVWSEVDNPSNTGSVAGLTGNHTITFPTGGIYKVEIDGDFPRVSFGSTANTNYDSEKLLTIEQWGDQVWTSMFSAFAQCSNLTIKANDIPDLSNVKDMSYMFYYATSFNSYIGDWDVSNVTNMGVMFSGAELFNQDIGSWDVSNVTNMHGMFNNAKKFSQNISNWNVGRVTDMSDMFYHAESFDRDINNWDVSSVENMYFMFGNAYAFSRPLSNWDVGNVTNMSGMFSINPFTLDFNTRGRFDRDISRWDVSNVTDMSYMFYNSRFNSHINFWNVGKVTDMNNMFAEAESFNQDISRWDVSKVTSMWLMFTGAVDFNQNLGNWNVSNVGNMGSIFGGTALSSDNYDKIIIAWSNLTLQHNVRFGGSDIFYCNAREERNHLIDTFRWVIHDAGSECPEPEIDLYDGSDTNSNEITNNQIAAIDFGSAVQGSTLTKGITIENQGQGDLLISNISFSGSAFSLIGDMPTIISVGQSEVITINLASSVPGSITETISIASNDSDESTFTFPLTGTFNAPTTTKSFITIWKTDNPGSSANNQITIPTIDGGYDYNLTWTEIGNAANTGSVTELTGNHTITFPTAGIYKVEIDGDFPRIYFGDEYGSNSDANKILTVEQWGDQIWSSMTAAFQGCSNLTMTANDEPDLSAVTSMAGMFLNASLFNGDIGSWDVSNVTDMQYLFAGARSFNQDIGNWDVSNVTHMNNMFFAAVSFNQDIGDWDVSRVVKMQWMFEEASKFNQDIGGWDVGSVDDMSFMFAFAVDFNANLNQWDVSNVTNMSYMFSDALSFGCDLNNWDVSNVTNMKDMFSINPFNHADFFNVRGSFNHDISRWDVRNVTNMGSMFAGSRFGWDITGWDVSNVADMSRMFLDDKFFDLNLGYWNISNVTNMSSMFGGSALSTSNYDKILISWSRLNLQQNVRLGAYDIFYCNSAEERSHIINNFGWNIDDAGSPCIAPEIVIYEGSGNSGMEISNGQSSAIDFGELVIGSSVSYDITIENQGQGDLIISNISFSGSTFSLMGDIPTTITAGQSKVITINLTSSVLGAITETVSIASNDSDESTFTFPLTGTFIAPTTTTSFITIWKTDNPGSSASNQITIPTIDGGYDYNLTWTEIGNTANTGSITNSAATQNIEFSSAGSDTDLTGDHTITFPNPGTYLVAIEGDFSRIYFNNEGDKEKILSVEQWGNQVWTSMESAFHGCANLVINATDVPNLSMVTSIRSMFEGAVSFNQDIGNWDVSNVEDMSYLFASATSFNQNIGGWDVGNVTNMSNLFNGATAFDQNIGDWNIGKVANIDQMLDNTALSIENYDSTLMSWAKLPSLQPDLTLGARGLYFCSGEPANNDLAEIHGWTIIDEGTGCPEPEIAVFEGTVADEAREIINGQTGAIDFGTEVQTISIIKELSIANQGSNELSISDITISGTVFTLLTSSTSSISGISNTTIGIAVRSSLVGTFNETVTISSNDADESSFSFPVTATIIAGEPEIVVFDGQNTNGVEITDGQNAAIDFGTDYQGTNLTRYITIQNTGTATLAIASVNFSGSPFSLIGNYPSSIDVGNTITLEVTLDGNTVGTFNETITITNSDVDESTFSFPLTGTIETPLLPEVSVFVGGDANGEQVTDNQSNAISFGVTDLHTNTEQVFTLQNDGEADLKVSSINISGSVFTHSTGLPITIPVGSSSNFSVSLNADQVGVFTENIVIVNNDADESTFEFTLAGEVIKENTAPTISSIAHKVINEDESSGAISFTVTDEESSADALTVHAVADNPLLITSSGITLEGNGEDRVLSILPEANANGFANITVTVDDGEASSSVQFILIVNAINDAPVITYAAELATVKNQPIDIDLRDLDVDDPDHDPEADFELYVLGGDNYTYSGTTITPARDYTGTIDVTLQVSDGERLSKPYTMLVRVGDITAIQPIDIAKELSVYPIPATTYLNFSFDNNLTGEFKVNVIDPTGRQLSTHSFDKRKRLYEGELSIEELNAGFYFLEITGKDFKTRRRFVK